MTRSSYFVLLLFLALPLAAVAQENRPPRPNENVKVLTELEGQPLRQEMQRIATALGVKCDHCHVPSDEKLPKRTARRMMEMTKGLNAQYFAKHEVKEGESVLGRVTCFTCHQGSTTPK